MKILLLAPCKEPRLRRPKTIIIPQLALQLLETLTPPQHEVKIIEEEASDINLDEECDLVGISCMTSNASRAYWLAQEFKKRGKAVVLGGIHPTILPDEAMKYADSVVIGEAEGVWGQLIEDFVNGQLKKSYYKPHPSLERYIPIKNNRTIKKRLFNAIPIMTTRGCPFNCSFCSVHEVYGKKIRHIPIKNVVQNIIDSEGKLFLFLDDNIFGDPHYAKKLFTAIQPLKINWGGQASINFVFGTELIQMAAASGCRGLFFGLESVTKSEREKMRKSIKDIEKVKEAIKRVKDLGIHFHASMIFGFDSDKKAIFPETLEFLQKNRVGTADFNILTPYPGTRIYRQFKEEGRLITNEWRYYDHSTVVFKPNNLTPLELQAGRLWTIKEFTKLSSTLARLPYNLSLPLFHMIINIGSRKSVATEIKNFPRLAYKLHQLERGETPNEKDAPLSLVQFNDFLPFDTTHTKIMRRVKSGFLKLKNL